jgi:hypothetical protein
MRTLPTTMVQVLAPFVPLFSERVWAHVRLLLAGAILAPGKRTVASALRAVGLQQERRFCRYHRVLSRASWSSRQASRALLGLLVETFVPEGPLVVGIDETLERRRGKKIAAKGIYRDPVRSSHSHFVKTSALRWVCVVVLTEVRWASRVWALPFLSALAPSERYATETGQRHKSLTEWAGQLLMLVRRWYPQREIVAVADSTYASLKLLDRCRGLSNPITFITRLRLDAALYEPAPPRYRGQSGRPRLKGDRLANLSVVAENPEAEWEPITITGWYGAQQRTVEVISATAVWYSTGLPAVPLRWVLIRDPKGEFETHALCYAPSSMQIPSGSSLTLSGDGSWRLLFKRCVSAWASRPSGSGLRRRSEGPPRRCWACSLWSPSWLTTRWLIMRTWTPFAERPGTTRAIRLSPTLWRWCESSCGPRNRLFTGRLHRPTW